MLTGFAQFGWRGALVAVCLLGCDEERVGLGQPCDTAQDCEGTLVCALREQGGTERQCASSDQTRQEPGCNPGATQIPCELILLKAAGEACTTVAECAADLLCTSSTDAGRTCTEPADAGT